MALSDWFQSIFILPFLVYASIIKRWPFGDIGCRIDGYVTGILGVQSIYTIVIISFERWQVIRASMPGQKSKKRTWIMSSLAWLVAALITSPPLYGWNEYVLEGLGIYCSFDVHAESWFHKSFILCLAFMAFVLPVFLISYFFISIGWNVRRLKKEMQSFGDKKKSNNNNNDDQKSKRFSKDIKLVLLLLRLFLLFMFAWFPYALVSMLALFDVVDVTTPYNELIGSAPAMFAKTSCAYNPFIYAISYPSFKKAFARTFPSLGKLLGLEEATKSYVGTTNAYAVSMKGHSSESMTAREGIQSENRF